MHLVSVIWFHCCTWFAQSFRDDWSALQNLQSLSPHRPRTPRRCGSLCVVAAVSFVIAPAPRVQTGIDTTRVTFTDIIGELGSVESRPSTGGFSGDSGLDSDGPALHFLTPDLLERSWRSLEPSIDLIMPCERGVWSTTFGRNQFGFHDVPGIHWTRLVPPTLQQVEVSERPTKIPKKVHVADHWRQVVANTDAASWKEDQEAKMDVALKRWFDIIAQFPEVHETVKQLYLAASLSEQLRTLRDILSGKAPSALTKRANALLRYIEKLREARIAVPGDEALLYNYFCELRDAGVPLSRLRALVESIGFTEFVLGIDGLCQRLLPKRCLGASRRTGETVTRQSGPFTVRRLACLHKVVHDDTELFWIRLVCGAAVVATYTRSRWMNMQHTVAIVLDPSELYPVFIELKIKEFRTRKTNAWSGGTMAAVGPALGAVQGNWVKAWWSLRVQLDVPINAGFPLTPAPDVNGDPTIRLLTTTEVGKWIERILDRAKLLTPDSKISSHSCKATMLSYLAKFGASVPDREFLGSASRSGMMLTEVKEETVVIDDEFSFEVVGNDQIALDEEAGAEPGSGSVHPQIRGRAGGWHSCSTHGLCSKAAPWHTSAAAPQISDVAPNPRGVQSYLMCGLKAEVTNYKPPASLRWDTLQCNRRWRAANTPLTSRLR